jgi:protein transport protein SEC61 subunit gamma-like protein
MADDETSDTEGRPAGAPAPSPHEGEAQGFVDKAWEAQYRVESRFKKLGRGKYSRVLKMARKPEHDEFVRASQITAIGIAIIGLIGFLILLFMGWLMNLLGVK